MSDKVILLVEDNPDDEDAKPAWWLAGEELALRLHRLVLLELRVPREAQHRSPVVALRGSEHWDVETNVEETQAGLHGERDRDEQCDEGGELDQEPAHLRWAHRLGGNGRIERSAGDVHGAQNWK